MRMKGLLIKKNLYFSDSRGDFLKIFNKEDEFENINFEFGQVNFTRTKKAGTIRGMHYQIEPFSEIKVITCLKGAIFDVALDLRKDSETFLKHESVELNEANRLSLIIPKGVAHGFQSLTDNVEMLYLHSAKYSPEHDFGISPIDPLLNIAWPTDISEISERDIAHNRIHKNFKGIEINDM